VKRVALFVRPKAAQQTTTPKGGGFVLPGRVKQSRYEVPMVFFCDPVQSTGFPKQTTKAAVCKKGGVKKVIFDFAI
jgi:hypothetical protein